MANVCSPGPGVTSHSLGPALILTGYGIPSSFQLKDAFTFLILVLAANTSFADFPRLASFHAGDNFMPKQLTKRGHRLVFSNGIIILALMASAPASSVVAPEYVFVCVSTSVPAPSLSRPRCAAPSPASTTSGEAAWEDAEEVSADASGVTDP